MTQDARQVQEILEKAAYFVVFSVPDPQSLSHGTSLLSFLPAAVIKISITEAPRRIQVAAQPVSAECGFRVAKAISRRQIADQTLDLTMGPNNWQSGPGRTPWPVVLLPFLSQRFWMDNGHFVFRTGTGTGFRAVADGRFFPAGGSSVWVSGVADILEGQGSLEGFTGNLVINGLTTPPSDFANNFLFRFVDPKGELTAETLEPVLPEEPDPDYSDSAVIPLVAAPHPGVPLQVESIPGSSRKRFSIVEKLRLAQTNFDVREGFLKSKTVIGEEVGERRTTLVFDPDFEAGDPPGTIAMDSVDSEFSFYAGETPIGTLKVDLAEGRAFKTTQEGLENPYYRIAGFGPYREGTGQFQGLEGQGVLSLNGALSLEPYALSSMYMLRIRDPQGRFRRTWTEAA